MFTIGLLFEFTGTFLLTTLKPTKIPALRPLMPSHTHRFSAVFFQRSFRCDKTIAIWLLNIDPENDQFLMELIFQALFARVYVNLPEGTIWLLNIADWKIPN